jgi:hypothetical protein
MAARAMGIVLVVAGFAVALLLAILGVDLVRACRTGPRWKRRLIGAGLVLLMALGLAPAGARDAAAEESKPAAPAAPAASDKGLAEAKGWNRIVAAWNEAEEIASGKRGDYPFDEAGKKRLLEDLKKAEADVADLQKTKLITQPEAGLLLKDLGTLTAGVLAKAPTEMKMVTCYVPMMIRPGHDSLQRLSDRLPLLEKLAASKTLHREVVEKVLARVEADIQNLGKEESLKALAQTAEREKAEKTRDAARAAVLRIRDRVWPPATAGAASEKTLDESKGWKRILAAWNEAAEIASGKRGDYPFDEAGKKRLLEDLKKAEADAADLQKAKLITEPEAGLLLKNLGTLTAGVHAKRPTEMKMATCYKPMMIQPGHDSLTRLSDRLPLLEKLAAAETLHREVVEKVLASVEADIQTLAKEESLKEFTKAEGREKAEKTRDAAKASALRLRQRITAPVMCYYLYLMSIPLREPESKQEQSVARLRILETPAATAALRPDVLHKAAANARTLENET